MIGTVRSAGPLTAWFAQVRAWFMHAAPIRRIEFTAAPLAATVWPEAAVAALAHALERTLAAEAADARTVVDDVEVALPVKAVSRPLAAQLAVQARRNVPSGRRPRPARVARTSASARVKPVRATPAPKRPGRSPAAWIQARHAAR
jgi:hypothetical protein